MKIENYKDLKAEISRLEEKKKSFRKNFFLKSCIP